MRAVTKEFRCISSFRSRTTLRRNLQTKDVRIKTGLVLVGQTRKKKENILIVAPRIDKNNISHYNNANTAQRNKTYQRPTNKARPRFELVFIHVIFWDENLRLEP